MANTLERMSSSPLIESLSAAVAANPDDLPLRLHLAELLVAADRGGEAVGHAARVLQQDPGNTSARQLMAAALGTPVPAATGPAPTGVPVGDGDVDWQALEREFAGVSAPTHGNVPAATDAPLLADVGGLTEVKKRLELAFLGPLRHPELLAAYGKSLRGGLLLYGPPGCGKTFLARALATELGARFLSLSIVDVLDMWVGNSERNLHDVFERARAGAPTVLFLDEVDALGHRRGQLAAAPMRTLANQLLAELDGVEGNNDNLFVLAATNAPWDVDPALRRPGRLDRMALVLPPDAAARVEILRYHLRSRPVGPVDLDRVAAGTEHFSGADLAHLCESAAEHALAESLRAGAGGSSTGEVRPIGTADFEAALREVHPSTGPWFTDAANVARYANQDGTYDDLAAYLKRRKRI